MSQVTERYREPPPGWPSAADLTSRSRGVGVFLLPEDVRDLGQEGLVAPFRVQAQELRVLAQESGLRAELVVPEGARPTVYSEHAADWVLPVVFSVPATVAANLVSQWIWSRLLTRHDESSMPTLRYREAQLDGDRIRVREIDGPADAVRAILLDDLRGRGQGDADDQREQAPDDDTE